MAELAEPRWAKLFLSSAIFKDPNLAQLSHFLGNPAVRSSLYHFDSSGAHISELQWWHFVFRVIDDYSLVNFYPLDSSDQESIGYTLAMVDNMIQWGEDQDVKMKDDPEKDDLEQDFKDMGLEWQRKKKVYRMKPETCLADNICQKKDNCVFRQYQNVDLDLQFIDKVPWICSQV